MMSLIPQIRSLEFCSVELQGSFELAANVASREQTPRIFPVLRRGLRVLFCQLLPNAKIDRRENRLISLAFVVLPVRIELTTSPLPRECSTTELRQRPPCTASMECIRGP
jgi:hypothetical protein